MLRGKFEFLEVVTICDHLCFFHLCKAKHEILWKTIGVSFDGLIKNFRLHSVSLGKIGIENDLLTAKGQDQRFNGFQLTHRSLFSKGWNFSTGFFQGLETFS